LLEDWCVARRCEAECRQRQLEHVPGLVNGDAHGRGHARQQQAVGVRGGEHHRVGDDVLHHLRRLAQAGDGGLEQPAGIGVDAELGGLPERHLADVGLVDAGVDLHLAEVAGNGEEGRRLEAGGHRLSLVYVAADDDAVDRRADGGALEVDLGRLLDRPLLRHRGLRVGELGPGALEVDRRTLDRERVRGEDRLGLADLCRRLLARRFDLLELGCGDGAALLQRGGALERLDGVAVAGAGIVEPGLPALSRRRPRP
jgi:hypothetical protein